MAKMDEEALESKVLALFKTGLNTQIASIFTEKGDAIDPPVFKDSDWVDNLSQGYNNKGKFIYFTVESSDPIDGGKSTPGSARTVVLVAFCLVPKLNDSKARQKAYRVTRAFREVLELNARTGSISSRSDFNISTLSPESVALSDAQSTYWMAGVRFSTTLY